MPDRRSVGRRLKRWIRREVVDPFRVPHRPPAYEARFPRKRSGVLHSALAPYRRWRDRRAFPRLVRSTDIFVVGHPKSGNTWTAYMLGVARSHVSGGEVTMANLSRHVPFFHGEDGAIRMHEDLADPRIFRNEWPIYPEHYPKTIYLIRDPRAVLVSYYHMFRTLFDGEPSTLDAFVREYLEHGEIRRFEPLVRWDRQVESWIQRARTNHRVLLLRYEDMLADRVSTVRRMVEFAEMPCGPEGVERATERGAFKSMKADEARNGAEVYEAVAEGRGSFIRKGKADAWKEELSPGLVRVVEAELGRVMELVGYA